LERPPSGETSSAGSEDLLDFFADAFVNGVGLDAGPAIGEPFVEVFAEGEAVPVAFDREVVTGLGKGFQGGFYVADVKARFGNREADFWLRGVGFGLAAVGLEEDGRGHLAVEPGVLDGLLGFGVEPDGV